MRVVPCLPHTLMAAEAFEGDFPEDGQAFGAALRANVCLIKADAGMCFPFQPASSLYRY